jgi:hypothetical protein
VRAGGPLVGVDKNGRCVAAARAQERHALRSHWTPWLGSLVQWSCTWYEFVPVVQFVALELGKPVDVPIV